MHGHMNVIKKAPNLFER